MPKGVSPPKDRRHLVMSSKGSQRCDCRVDRYAVTRLIVARAHPRNSENVVEPKSDNQTEAPQGIVLLLPSHRPIRAGRPSTRGTEPNFLAAEAFPTENRNHKNLMANISGSPTNRSIDELRMKNKSWRTD